MARHKRVVIGLAVSLVLAAIVLAMRARPARTRLNSPVLVRKIQTDAVSALAVSGDGKTLYTASEDGSIWAVDTSSLAPVSCIYSGSDAIESLALSPDGRVCAAGMASGKIVRVSLTEPFESTASEDGVGGRTSLHAVMFSKDGRRIYSTRDSGVIAFDSDLRSYERVIPCESAAVSLSASPDGSLLAAAEASGLVHLINLKSRANVRSLNTDSRSQPVVQFSFDGRFLAAGETRGNDTKVLAYSGAAWGHASVMLRPGAGGLLALAFSPKNDALAIAGVNFSMKGLDRVGKILVIDPASLRELHYFRVHETVTAVAFAPDGRWLYAGDRSGRVHRFELSAASGR